MDKKKKKLVAVIAIVLVLAAVGAAVWFFKFRGTETTSAKNLVYVDSVENLTGLGSGNGLNGRFSGVVEPQETWKIEVSQDKKVKEIYVKEGQEVKIGDKLFTYDTQDAEDSLNQAEIDLERLQSDIETAKNNIAELEREKKQASADEQLSYTTQIQTTQNSIKRSEYEKKTKAVEIENLKKGIANSDVMCEIDGIVKSINQDGNATNSNGETEPFMTVLTTGDYRIKGKVNEQNISAIMEGEPVIIRSRVDEKQIWKGTLTAVEKDKPEKNQSSMYSGMGSSENNSSSYPFYAVLESADGLMLGQHVYIEMDEGQMEKKEGLWLDSYYLVIEEENPNEAYVWAANAKDKIEKRKVTLGEFDEELQKYQILDGLTTEDYIAYPDTAIEAGAPVTRNFNDIMEQQMQNNEDGDGTGENMPGDMDLNDNVQQGETGTQEVMPRTKVIGEDEDSGEVDFNDKVGGNEDTAIPAPSPITVEGDGSAPVRAGEY